MLKSEIRVGESYVIGGHGLGRALVLEPPEAAPYRNRKFTVKVEYPDAPASTPDHRRKMVASTTDISRKWNEEDQKRFEKMQRAIEDQRGWQEELLLAGYDGVVHVSTNMKIQITFSGRAAELVLEKLTGHEIPEDKKGEYA